jgi:hypothetical protein
MAEPLIGPQPIIGPGDSPDVIGGEGPTTEYAPMNNAARVAIFGTNPATGVAYTDAESAAANAGWNPWAGSIGYQIDPRTGNLNILKNDGTVMTTGATYQTTSRGAIVPSDAYMQGFNQRRLASGQSPIAFDEYGVQVNINPNGPTVDSQGKVITVAFDAAGSAKDISSFIADKNATANNPYAPGTPQYEDFKERRSAYDLLFSEFKQYGLDSLVTPLKDLIMEGVSPAEFTIRLRETEPYKKRFAANAQRVAKGLRALSEAEYIGTEDQYQDVMRRYGMPESYYTKGDLGIQSGFEKFLAGDVSAVELEDRIQTAQNRVVNSNPEVARALKEFYPGISNGDILAYVLDPANAIEQIKRKVTAAEIGGAAIQSGLKTGMTRAEELAAAGITKAQAQQGFQTVAEVAPRGGTLAEIYKQDPYTQTTAEQEVFGLTGAVDAARQRKKLTQLETAAFSGSAGMGAIARDRAGAI